MPTTLIKLNEHMLKKTEIQQERRGIGEGNGEIKIIKITTYMYEVLNNF